MLNSDWLIPDLSLIFWLRFDCKVLCNRPLGPVAYNLPLTLTLLSMVSTMATMHHNQSASRIVWKLPLKSYLPLMVSFMQRGPWYKQTIFSCPNVNELICFCVLLFIDYWYMYKKKKSPSQGSRYTEFPLYRLRFYSFIFCCNLAWAL